MFIESVAKGRGVTAVAVRGGYGEGRVLNAKDAKKEGMVDRIDTLDGVLARLGVGSSAQKTNMAMAEKRLALLSA
jgi:ClpP class serine protease